MKPKLFGYKSYRFLVIAHRGASYYRPENTFSAFNEAVRMGADMIELDVLLTKDQVPVVIHDENLSRLTGSKELVSNLTLSQLQQTEVGSWFDKKYEGEKVPSLKEVLEWAKGRISLNVEVKTEAVADSGENGIEQQTIKLIRHFDMENHVLLSSFDGRAMKRFKMMAPEIARGYLFSKETARDKSISELIDEYGADFFHSTAWNLSKRRLNNLNQINCPALVYTVNSKRKMKNLISKGVFGIFSDRPDRLRDIADEEIPDRLYQS